MPLVEENAVDDALDSLVDRGIGEDDGCGLATELERVLLVRAGERFLNNTANAG